MIRLTRLVLVALLAAADRFVLRLERLQREYQHIFDRIGDRIRGEPERSE